MFNEFDVNLIYYRERRIVKGEEKETEDIPAQLNNSVQNWINCSKEGDACQEENAKFIHNFFWQEFV